MKYLVVREGSLALGERGKGEAYVVLAYHSFPPESCLALLPTGILFSTPWPYHTIMI